MDNRSIAAFIETNKTRMNSVICTSIKGAGQENAKSNDTEGANKKNV